MPTAPFPAMTVPFVEDLRYVDPYPTSAPEQTTMTVQRYHTWSEGGGGTFYFRKFDTPGDPNNPTHDGGIFISSYVVSEEIGIWVRVFSGYIDMRFYGILDGGTDCTNQIQAAINYAAKCHEDVSVRPIEHNNSNTVYIPNGSYWVTKLVMKTGVTLMGASFHNTQINSINEDDPFLIELEYNKITRNISIQNIEFWGNSATLKEKDFDKEGQPYKIKGCFGFIVPANKEILGGIWESNFKNLMIRKFTGDSIRFQCELGYDQWFATNQWITMENVFVESVGELQKVCPAFRNRHHALAVTGNAGQFVFTNCRFDGGDYLFSYDPPYVISGTNVFISSTPIKNAPNPLLVPGPSVITFNTCTIQSGANGIVVESANNIKIDACWFESEERAIISKGTYKPSKSINVLNNLFSYTAGNYGELPPDTGRVIIAQNSHMNVYNNYVCDPLQKELTSFIALDFENDKPTENLGVNGYGNYFEPNKEPQKYLGYTWQMVKKITVTGPQVDFIGARTIYLSNESDTQEVNVFTSYDITSDYIFVKAQKGNFKLTEKGNLYLGNRTIDFKEGDSAFFIKSDDHYVQGTPPNDIKYFERYNLVAHLPKI